MKFSKISGRIDNLCVGYPSADSLDEWDKYVCSGLSCANAGLIPKDVRKSYNVVRVHHDPLSGRCSVWLSPLPEAKDRPTIFEAIRAVNA